MNKKTVVAFYVSTNEKLLKIWRYEVSHDIEMIDISVPQNTVFSFFSKDKEVKLDVVQIKLMNNITDASISILKNYICNNKIFCYGQNENGIVVVEGEKQPFYFPNFIEQMVKLGISIEYI